MDDAKNDTLRIRFDSRLRANFLGSQITTNAKLLAYRKLDEAFALTGMVQDTFQGIRIGSNKQHQLLLLRRQSICSRLAGYEDANHAEQH
ncbi:MAG: hypothetical protein MK171_05955 [Pirellulales bacterium]|nr:hypothetical protein [Pirellulales bacterium]